MEKKKLIWHKIAAIPLFLVIVAGFLELFSVYIIKILQINYYLPLQLAGTELPGLVEKFRTTYSKELGWEEPQNDNPAAYRGPSRDHTRALIAFYGDSFTYGHLDNDSSWTTLLEKQTGELVLNYGVQAYGTDQAYLRFLRRYPGEVPCEYVCLCVMSENIARIVNRYRGFYSRNYHIGATKPIFRLGPGDSLILLPNPLSSPSEMVRLTDASFRREIGREDYWYGYYDAYGLNRLPHFPYCYYFIKALPFYIERFNTNVVKGKAEYYPLYEDSKIVGLLKKIIEEFVRNARVRSVRPIIMFFPSNRDLKQLASTGTMIYADLKDKVKAAGVPVLDAGDYFLPLLKAGESPDDFFRSRSDQHYNAMGEATVARGVYRDLIKLKLMQDSMANSGVLPD